MKVIYIMAAEFRLNTEELFADSLANHELDAYSSVNEAYESLLINRESETLLHELNDDEKNEYNNNK
jgi:urate oxidase